MTVPERFCADASPAIVIRAHGHDQARHFAVPGRDTARGAVGISIGRRRWLGVLAVPERLRNATNP